jgi:hypothetical protein
MAIPNTTPTPNELYNGEMNKMSDTELRVVLVVTRATLGWELDPITKTRKKEDWISSSQIKEKTGRSGRAISTAIESSIKNGWIEARDSKGELLDTPQKRAGKKIYFRLGKIFLLKIETSENSSQGNQTSEKSSNENISNENSSHYKRNTITKEIKNTKTAKQSFAGLNDLIELFKEVNPSYDRLFGNKTQRAALERLVKKFGPEKVESMIKGLKGIFGRPYAPSITTPYLLETKLADYINYLKKRSEEKVDYIDFTKL